MTKEEKHLWYDFLKQYPVKFYRQRVIGAYIVDFYCSKASLVIELDGNQHYSDDNAEMRDRIRTDYLANHGIYVLRFTNLDVNERFHSVCETIDRYVISHVTDTKVSPA